MSKKYLLLLPFLLLLIPFQSYAALQFLGSASSTKTTASRFVTLSTSTTAGNLLVKACLQTGGGSNFQAGTATSSDGTAWTLYAVSSGTSFGTIEGFYGIAATTGAIVSSTCSYAASSTDLAEWLFQYSGNATTSVLDTTSTFFTNTAITSSTQTYSTTNASDTIVSMVYANADGSLTSVSSPFTARYTRVGLFGAGGADFITSTIQTNSTIKWTFSLSVFTSIIGSFKEAPSVVTAAAAPTVSSTVNLAGSSNLAGSVWFH